MPSTNSATNKAIVAYVPALHAGYISFFNKHPTATVFVLGKTFIDAYPRLNRDLRALPPTDVVTILRALKYQAEVLEVPDIKKVLSFKSIVLPDEDVSQDFAKKYLKTPVFESIFLRWDGRMPDKQKEVSSNRIITTAKLDQEFMRQAAAEGQKSPDWWRQIGGVLAKDGKVIFSTHTQHFPSDHALDIFGTPRSNYDAGERPEVYISQHAEAGLIAKAAQAGISTQGAFIYTSTFPCINCAFLIVRAGISKVYYKTGYSNLNSEDVLKSAGVEIIFVEGV